ncbi:MAG: hypothetical protein ING59_16630 [Burkholderiales bacterium]|nr:hypothetical protein [Burkholderiales bacterium]
MMQAKRTTTIRGFDNRSQRVIVEASSENESSLMLLSAEALLSEFGDALSAADCEQVCAWQAHWRRQRQVRERLRLAGALDVPEAGPAAH